MRTRLTRIGNDLVLLLDAALVEQLGLTETSEVDLSVEDGALVMRVVEHDADEQKFKDSAENILQ